jgi:hypothetical protein
MHPLTLEELKQKREENLLGSERAIRHQCDAYRELKKLVNDINTGPLDVADYYRSASRLGFLLSELSACSSHTIFHYFAEQIDPGKVSDVRYFRLECMDLAQQIRDFDQWRTQRHRLKRIK